MNATLGLARNLSSEPQYRFQAGKGTARQANPTADFVFSLTSYRERRAQILEGLDLLQEYATKNK